MTSNVAAKCRAQRPLRPSEAEGTLRREPPPISPKRRGCFGESCNMQSPPLPPKRKGRWGTRPEGDEIQGVGCGRKRGREGEREGGRERHRERGARRTDEREGGSEGDRREKAEVGTSVVR